MASRFEELEGRHGHSQSPTSADRTRVGSALKMLCAAFNKRLDPEAFLFWVRKLEEFEGPALDAALSSAVNMPRFPSLHDLMAAVRAEMVRRKNAKGLPEAPKLSADEKARSDRSAVMSMLWLHYEKGWSLDDFGGHVLARRFASQVKNPKEALVAAKEVYDKETVSKWMEAQPR